MRTLLKAVLSVSLLGVVSLGAVPGARGEDVSQPFLSLDAGGHTARVWSVLFTPDDRELISLSEDKTIRVWDLRTGDRLKTFRLPIGPGNEGKRYAGRLLADGKTLAVAGFGVLKDDNVGAIFLVSLDDGSILRTLKGHADVVFTLAASFDGKRIASGSSDATVKIWNVQTGALERTLTGHGKPVYGVDFSPDGRRLVSVGYDGFGRIWDVPTGKLLAKLPHPHEVRNVDWSPDGRTIATACLDASIRFWNADGKLRKTLDSPGKGVQLTSVRFRADSKQLVATLTALGGIGRCGVVDVATGEGLALYEGHRNTVMDAAFSHNGRIIASGDHFGEVHLWKPTDGAALRRFVSPGKSIVSVGWNETGTMIAFGTTFKTNTFRADSRLEWIFDLTRLEMINAPQERFSKARLRNGDVFLHTSGGTSVDLWLKDKKVGALQQATEYDQQNNTVHSYSLLRGPRAVTAHEFGNASLFDLETGKQIRSFVGHTGSIWAVSPSPDGKLFLTGSSDQTINLWNMERDRPLLTFFFAENDWIVWTPEGYYATSAAGERLMGWHVNNGLDKAASFFPANQFHKTLYRPEVIRETARTGSVEQALKLAGESADTAIQKVIPPRVEIVQPSRSPLAVSDPAVRIQARARPAGGQAVTSMQVYLDGRPVADEAGRVVFDDTRTDYPHEFSLTLPPGVHRVSVRADSAVSYAFSSAVEFEYRTMSAEDESLPSLYVLAVGVSDYQAEELKLNFAARDAQRIEGAFKQHAPGLFRRVETRLLTDQAATRAGILDGLQWLKSQVTQHDVGVVFYSGHGERDGTGFHLLPCDVNPNNLLVTAVPDSQIKGVLQGIPGRLLIMLDACHAGALTGDKRKNAKSLTDDLVRDLANDDYGVIVMASSMGRETSLESSQHQNGFFTVALTEGLAGLHASDANSDGLIYSTELDSYVSQRVKDLTNGRQHPVTAKPTTIRPFPLTRK